MCTEVLASLGSKVVVYHVVTSCAHAHFGRPSRRGLGVWVSHDSQMQILNTKLHEICNCILFRLFRAHLDLSFVSRKCCYFLILVVEWGFFWDKRWRMRGSVPRDESCMYLSCMSLGYGLGVCVSMDPLHVEEKSVKLRKLSSNGRHIGV